MAAPKRKAENTASTPKKEAGASGDRSAKRQRKSDVGATNGAAPSKAPIAKTEKAPAKSVFNDGEKAFPRGGASVLTPLEHKQIQIKANQDVLFEAAGAKRTKDTDMSDAGSDMDEENAEKASKKRKSKKSKKTLEEETENVVKVEGLSYKVGKIGTAYGTMLTFNREWFRGPSYWDRSLILRPAILPSPYPTTSSDSSPSLLSPIS
jgi:rRNA biogenesis protein RRP5